MKTVLEKLFLLTVLSLCACSSTEDIEQSGTDEEVIPQLLSMEFEASMNPPGLKKDVVIVGTADGRAEVWDADKWNSENGNISPEDAAKNLFDRGIVL